MIVKDELQKIVDASASRISKDSLEIMARSQQELNELNPIENMIGQGQNFPNFSLLDYKNQKKTLDEFLGEGNIVITFYRGAWCPYCNVELQGYKEILPDIIKKGAKLIAVSPELPDNSSKLVEKLGLDYEVLSDVDNILAKELGIVFTASNELVDAYKTFGIDLTASQGNSKNELPVPAVYVLDSTGKILFCSAELDYRIRFEPRTILEYL